MEGKIWSLNTTVFTNCHRTIINHFLLRKTRKGTPKMSIHKQNLFVFPGKFTRRPCLHVLDPGSLACVQTYRTWAYELVNCCHFFCYLVIPHRIVSTFTSALAILTNSNILQSLTFFLVYSALLPYKPYEQEHAHHLLFVY